MTRKLRPIAPAEAELVHWLLTESAIVDGADALISQVPGLLVSGACDCGCPSVDFFVEGLSATAMIVAEADGRSPEDAPVGVLLWARAGRLSGLEVYDLSDATTTSLPRPAALHPAFTISAP